MSGKASPGDTRAVRLLLKAIRSLPEREQQAVLAYLLRRALEPPDRPQQVFGPSFITPKFVREVGSTAGVMLRSGQGVREIAGLYGIPEETVRAAIHQLASDPEAPQPLGSILALLAEGRTRAKAARELGLSDDELGRALDGFASSPLEGRLGQALFSYARMRARASVAFAWASPRVQPGMEFGPRRGPPAGDPEGLAARIGRLLLADSDLGQIATLLDLTEGDVRAALHEVAAHPDASEPLASVLRLAADGRRRAEVADELRISEEEVKAALEELLPSPLGRRLVHSLQAFVAARSVAPPSPSSLPGVTVTGSLGSEPQMVPVRFPEPQYRRLKEWCGRHDFSMAVVVRGLVERFLDDQDRRAA